jgi:hypothetical protein
MQMPETLFGSIAAKQLRFAVLFDRSLGIRGHRD